MSGGLPSGVNASVQPAERPGYRVMRSAIGLLRNQ